MDHKNIETQLDEFDLQAERETLALKKQKRYFIQHRVQRQISDYNVELFEKLFRK